VIALVAIAVWFVLLSLFRAIKNANVDWTGVTTIIGFIMLAFYLRYVTGIG
jgi:hypothetical protein